jgi:chromate transporter
MPAPMQERRAVAGDWPAPSLPRVFLTCLKIGSLSFGGGGSGWVHREFVVRHRWVDDEAFAANLGVSRILPGPSTLNLLVCLGNDLLGTRGALACIVGYIIGPLHIVLLLWAAYSALQDRTLFEAFNLGMAFAAIGLMLLVCWTGARAVARHGPGLWVAAATAVAVAGLGLPLVPVVAVIGPVSVFLAARRLRGA